MSDGSKKFFNCVVGDVMCSIDGKFVVLCDKDNVGL